MIFPSIEQLTQDNKYNRYELVIATAKAARIITDDINEQKEEMERNAGIKDANPNDKMFALQREFKEVPEEKSVKSAIWKIYDGEYVIIAD